jgi:hypothetical protein
VIGLPFGNTAPGDRDRWRGVLFLLPAAAISVALSACATTRAAAVVEGPPLSVPQPPERVVVPPEEEPLVATGNGPDTPLLQSPRLTQTSPPRRTQPVRGETDTRAEAPAAAASGPVGPTAAAVETPRELKPVPSPAEPAVDVNNIQTLLNQVDALLKAVDPSKYNTGTYKDAKQYVAQANKKLKERNLYAASDAADKAYKLALTLNGR